MIPSGKKRYFPRDVPRAVALCALAACFCAALRADEAAVVAMPESWPVGAVTQGTRLEKDFKIRAVGGGVTLESAWAPCEDCLAAHIIRREGGPEAPALVRAVLDTSELAGEFRKVILVSSRKPRAILRIEVHGRTYPDVPRPFTIELFYSAEDAEGTATAGRLKSQLEERGLPEGVSLALLPIDDIENYRLLRRRELALGIRTFRSIECFVGGKVFLAGEEEISTGLERLLFPKAAPQPDGAQEADAPEGPPGLPFGPDAPADRLQVLLLYSPDCRGCRAVLEYLDDALRRLSGRIAFHRMNVTSGGNTLIAMALIERYSISDPRGVILLAGDESVCGRDEILSRAVPLIEAQLEKGAPHLHVLEPERVADIEHRASALSIAVVAAAGLVDGINPCAFATMVLFLAVLSALKSGPWRMLSAGLAFCAGVFSAYYLIGLALFRGFRSLSGVRAVGDILHWVFFGMAVLLGVLSLVDAVKYRLSGRTGSLMLRVPETLRKRFAGIMRSRLGAWGIAFGAFACGLVIAVIEGICTGQMYLPVIGHMARTPGLKAQGHLYLLMYNGLFILPLAVICGLCVAGVGFRRLGGFLERHLAAAKVLLAGVFFLLAGAMLWYG